MVVTEVIPMLGGVGAPLGKCHFLGRINLRIVLNKRARRDLFKETNHTGIHSFTPPPVSTGGLCCEVHQGHPDPARAGRPHESRFIRFQRLLI